MPKIQIARRGSPVQVDDFPSEVRAGAVIRAFVRSCEGALYFRPGTLMVVTEDELHHVQATPKHAALAARITVLPKERVKAVAPASKSKPSASKFDDGKGASKKPKGNQAS